MIAPADRHTTSFIGQARPAEPPDALLLCWIGALIGDKERAQARDAALPEITPRVCPRRIPRRKELS